MFQSQQTPTHRAVGLDLDLPNDVEPIDVSDQYLFPGGVDLDCYLTSSPLPNETRPADNLETGSLAALLGGTTTIVNTVKVKECESLVSAFTNFIEAVEKQQMKCDYAVRLQFPSNASIARLDNDESSSELEHLATSKGVSLCYIPASADIDTNRLVAMLRLCRQAGVLPSIDASGSQVLIDKCIDRLLVKHPNIGPELHLESSSESAEASSLLKAVLAASQSGFLCPLLINRLHSSSALDCFLDQRMASFGLLFGQTTVAALCSTSGQKTLASDWVKAVNHLTSPPLRPDADLKVKLANALSSNALTCVSSGHRAFTTSVRAAFVSREVPQGIAALGWRLTALWNSYCCPDNPLIDLCTFVKAVSTGPAQLANLYPRKGRIGIDSDADIVVWSRPGQEFDNQLDACLLPDGVYNIFANLTITGRPDKVFLGGHKVVDGGKLDSACQVQGSYLFCQTFNPLAFGRLSLLEKTLKARNVVISREPYTGPVIDQGQQNGKEEKPTVEHHFFRKEDYDNIPKVALPPGHRQIHTSVKTVQPPGGASNTFWTR